MRMKRLSVSVAALAMMALTLNACGGSRQERTATGGLGGAAAGALVGGPVGAVVGAGVGAAGGNVMREGVDTKARRMMSSQDQPVGAGVQFEPYPPLLLSAEKISQAQQALKREGYRTGPSDGKFGPRTQAALMAFQRDRSLRATGQFDLPSLTALGVDPDEPQY